MSNNGGSQIKRRRICVMGYSRVGKSSLTIQFVHNNFPDSYEPTIANTFNKRFQINNNHYSLEVSVLALHVIFIELGIFEGRSHCFIPLVSVLRSYLLVVTNLL